MCVTTIYRFLPSRLTCVAFIFPLIICLVLEFCSSAQANPGDEWVFGDAPVPDNLYPPQRTPDISGDIVVWVDTSWPKTQIFYKNLLSSETEQPLSDSQKDQDFPRVSGSLVVWQEKVAEPSGPFWKVYYKYAGSAGPFPVSSSPYTQSNPYVAGTKIVWTDDRAGNGDIYMLDLASGQETAVCTKPNNQGKPVVDGDWVVWEDYSTRDTTIYTKNIVTSEERQIGTKAGSASINGDKIVYAQWGGATGYDIWLYNLATKEKRAIYSGAGTDAGPDIDGDKVVWQNWPDGTGGNSRKVYVHDLSSHLTVTIDTSVGAWGPRISPNRVVWCDFRTDSGGDIYKSELGDLAYALAMKYRPELNFRHDKDQGSRQDFEPRTVELMVDVPGTRLVTPNGDIYNPTIQTLINNPDAGNHIDLPKSPFNPFQLFHNYNSDYLDQLNNYPDRYQITAYTRVVHDAENTGKTVIQYWLLYYYNNWYNNHEGDWEMVEVILDQNLDPEAAAYSQHSYSQKKYWNEDGFEKSGTHPKVYVAEGSHSNIFDGGILDAHYLDGKLDLTGHVTSATPSTDMAWGNGDWVNYAGFWGEKEGSHWPRWAESGPPGPRFQPVNPDNQKSPWTEPVSWADPTKKGDDNDTVISAHSPVEIHLYDAQGNHIGKNTSGGIDKQIPRAEYFERSEDHSKNIVIHGADISGNYRLEIVGTGTGTMDLDVQTPDFAGNLVDKNNYLAVPVGTATKAKLDITTSKDFALKIDSNGDGVYEGQRSPDVSLPKTVDFTPPSQITNLGVTNVTSGTTTLSWASPGDDGNQGTATRYELRCATSPITDASWDYASITGSLPDPQVAGTTQTATVQGLNAGTTYYFAIKARDDAWQPGPISNIVTATTTIPNLSWSKQQVYWASWADYSNRQLSIDYKLSNVGTGAALSPALAASYCVPVTVYVTTALPQTVGDLNPNTYSIVTLKYYVPINVGSFTTTTYANCKDDAGRTYWFPGPLP